MAEIITAIYRLPSTLTNVFDDLISSGIPEDNIRIDEAKHQVQVVTPNVGEAEITEILNRHNPTELHT